MQISLRKIVVIATLAVTSSVGYADEQSSDPNLVGEEVEMQSRRLKDRPKAPSMQKIRCLYQDGWISIEFEIDEGMAELDVIDLATGFGSSQSFSTSAPAKLYVGKLNGPTQLVVNTAAGQSYEGYIY